MIRPDTLAGVPVLFVMAAQAEYGPALRARISPVITGVGPVEAAVSLTAALSSLAARHALPALVVSLGSAGSRHLPQGQVFQVSEVSWRDIDASALGFERGRTPFLDLPARIPLACNIPGLPVARLSTGGNVVSGAGYDAIDADLVDMETYAHLRAAQAFGVPLIGLRGVSDGAEDLRGLHDWTALLSEIDRALAHAVALLQQSLHDGTFEL